MESLRLETDAKLESEIAAPKAGVALAKEAIERRGEPDPGASKGAGTTGGARPPQPHRYVPIHVANRHASSKVNRWENVALVVE